MPNKPVKRSTKWHDEIEKKVLSNPVSRAAYEETKLQIELSEKIKTERKRLHLTQETIANRMGTKKPAIARLESGPRYGTSPSISTLSKFASAVGKKLTIKFDRIPKLPHR